MKCGWRKFKLKEFAKLIKKQYQPNGSEELIYIGLEHIEQQTLRINGYGNSKNVISQKYEFSCGDILFGRLRPYFRKVYRPKFAGVCSTDIWVINAKKGCDQGFLYYFLANQSFIDACNSGSSGTRMPRADWNHLSETEWELPPLPVQCRIADILSALDDKIELNRQTNATLEDIAQAIFKEWFVDFNFPGATGELVESELGMIPKGWKITKLGEILDIKGGTTPSTKIPEYWNGEFSFATPKDLSSNHSLFLLKTDRKITSKGVNQISSGILPSGTLLLSSRAPIGYLAISDIPVSVNQGFIAINAKEISNIFILLWLKNNIETVIGRANGSTFLEISKSNFREIKIILPDKKTIYLFEKLILPFFDYIKINEKQTISLATIRDTLLPKLMNGEIEV